VLVVVARPQELGERVTGVGPVVERQVGQERHGLAGVEGHGPSVALDAWRTEERYGERHSATIIALLPVS
jgi:hypothetical protein